MRFDWAMRFDWVAVRREALLRCLFFLPEDASITLERWLRGRQEFHRIGMADCNIVSFPNSGRTWLRVLLSRYYQLQEANVSATLIDLDHLSRLYPRVPKFHFTHDNYLRDYTRHSASKEAYSGKRIILLVRDPADVAVSQYHQWQRRMSRRKIRLNWYPLDESLSLYDFVRQGNGALLRILRFMNEWAPAISALDSVLLVKYEELASDTEACLIRILDFVGTPGTLLQIRHAISFASVENMRRLEDQGNALLRKGQFSTRLGAESEGYKARRAKVGGYRDDFTEEELAEIDRTINGTLSASFGYQRVSPSVASSLPISDRMRATL